MKKTLLNSNMKRALLCFIFITFGVSSINAQSPITADHYMAKIFDCAIFPAAYPTELDGKGFTPSHTDVDSVTKALTEKFKMLNVTNKDDRNTISSNLPLYKIQVFGYTDKAGNKVLYLNCFRNDRQKDKDLANTWTTDMVEVQDGGNYFWTIKYDLAKGAFFDFKVNGNG